MVLSVARFIGVTNPTSYVDFPEVSLNVACCCPFQQSYLKFEPRHPVLMML
jgi:hypothetical protein